jgi:hypothetical protein
VSAYNGRRDRGVALPSPVAAISIVAIVVAAIAFAVTGFGGNKTKVIPNAAPTSTISATSTPTATSTTTTTPTSSPTPTQTVAPIDKASIHVSVWNASTTPGLAKDVLVKVKAAGWTNSAAGNTKIHYATNTIYYPAKYAAAAKQLGLDLGITNLSQGDGGTPQDRISVVLVSPLS